LSCGNRKGIKKYVRDKTKVGRLARWLSFISSQSVDMDAAAAAATTAADAIDVFTTVQAPMRQRLPSV